MPLPSVSTGAETPAACAGASSERLPAAAEAGCAAAAAVDTATSEIGSTIAELKAIASHRTVSFISAAAAVNLENSGYKRR
eukprot:3449513-Pleurochrysis_carterae.AAC.1